MTRLVVLLSPRWLSDVESYGGKAKLIAAGHFAYGPEVGLEYPPGTLLIFNFTQWFASFRGIGFQSVYHHLAFFADLACWVLLVRFPTANTSRARAQKCASLLIYLWISLCMMQVFYERLDIWLALLTVIACGQLYKKNGFGSALALSLGAMIKFSPLVLLPVAALVKEQGKQAKPLIVRSLVAALPLGLMLAATAFYLKAHGSGWSFLTYHSARGIEIESIWASLLAVLDGLHAIQVVTNFGAQHVVSPSSGWVLAVSRFALPVSLLSVLVHLIWVGRGASAKSQDYGLRALLLLSLCFLVLNRIFSPQYWVGIAPILALQAYRTDLRREDYYAFGALMVGVLLTGVIFSNYWALSEFSPGAWGLLHLRNLLVLGAFIFFV